MCAELLHQDYQTRLGSGPRGVLEIKEHAYFADVDWELVPACTLPSPMKGVKGIPKRKKDKETQAQRTACNIAEADKAEVDSEHVQARCELGVPAAAAFRATLRPATFPPRLHPACTEGRVPQEYYVGTWDFVSAKAVTEEYMESMYQCVSSI